METMLHRRVKKGREREKEEESEKRGKEKMENGEQKKKEIVKGEEESLQLEGERYMKMSRLFFFFACLFFKPLIFVWDVPKWKWGGGIF